MTFEQHQQLGQWLYKVTDYMMEHRSKNCLPLATRDTLFRYVAFAHLTGRLSVAFDLQTMTKIEGVLISWVDWQEHIEAKAEAGVQQFEFVKAHPGDAVFVAEAMGSREAITRIAQAMFEKFPHLLVTPVYTYRHGKLHRLSMKRINQFMKEAK